MGRLDTTAKSAVQDGSEFAEQILNYFYPVHYRLGMELELAMGQGLIGRRQAALLWIIHSSSDKNGWVSRKIIERQLTRWFDLGAPGVSKLLRDVSTPACCFVEMTESPHSGREKMLRLTADGRAFIDGMIATAKEFLSARLEHMSPEELRRGLNFFQRAFG